MYASQHLVFSKSIGSISKKENDIKPTQPKQNAISMYNTERVVMPLI